MLGLEAFLCLLVEACRAGLDDCLCFVWLWFTHSFGRGLLGWFTEERGKSARRKERESERERETGRAETSSLVHGSFFWAHEGFQCPIFGIYSYGIQISNRNYCRSTVKTDPESVTLLTETPLRHKCFIVAVWKHFSVTRNENITG